VINDQITFSISSEYYTKFKFIQFNLLKEGDKKIYPRILVVLVTFSQLGGFINLGLILIFNLIQNTWKMLLKFCYSNISILITFFLDNRFYFRIFNYKNSEIFFQIGIPDKLMIMKIILPGQWIIFNFFGGILGLIVAIFYSYKKRNL
jgi:hypothetical protein